MSDNNILSFPGDENKLQQQQNSELPEYQKILLHIENNPNSTNTGKGTSESFNFLQLFINSFINSFITPSTDYHGKAHVTRTVKTKAKIVSIVNSGSNITDFLLNSTLFYFIFSNLGFLVALPASLAVNFSFLKIANATAAGVPACRKTNKNWSKTAMFAFIFMNVLQTTFSGVGSEAFNNQPELEENKAEELIVEQKEEVEELKTFVSPQLETVTKQCSDGEKQLAQLDRSNPYYDVLYVRLYGTWEERNKDWSKHSGSKPYCKHKDLLIAEQSARYEQAMSQFLANQSKYNTNKAFLRQEYPDLYAKTFTEEGKLASGVELIRLAIINLLAKIKSGQIASLGLTLILLSISIGTSTLAVVMTLVYVKRHDVQLSFDETIRIERDKWLENQIQAMNLAHLKEQRNLEADLEN